MITLTVSDEYAQIIANSASSVVVVDAHGKPLAKLAPLDASTMADQGTPAEVIADIRQRMAEDDGTRYTHAQVMAHLRALSPE